MATSPGTQIDTSFLREGSSLWTHLSAGREAFFHGHGGETLPENGAVQSASWPFMGGFAKTAVLWRQEGATFFCPYPGACWRSRDSEDPQNVIASQFAFSRRSNCPLVSRKVMRTAQSARSGEPSSFQTCPHHVEYSKFYQREQTEVTETPSGLCQTSAPPTIPLFSTGSGTTSGEDLKFWMLTGRSADTSDSGCVGTGGVG